MYPNLLCKRVELTPNRLAFHYNDQEWTWKQVLDKAFDYAERLPCEKGSRIGIWAKNSPELYFLIQAALLKDCELVFFNHRLIEQELIYQIQDAAVDLVFVDEMNGDILEGLTMHPLGNLKQLDRKNFGMTEQWEPTKTISIMYTSGTTGQPKGVRQTLENHMSSALGAAITTGLLPQDKWLCVMPLYHISGFSIVMRSLIYGSAIELQDRFDAEQVVKSILSNEITHLSVVTTMLGQLLDVIEQKELLVPSTFRTVLAGGGPVPVSYLTRSEHLGLPVVQTYGMTETSSQTCTLLPEDAIRKLGSAGKPLFFADIKIEGGTEGEILVRGPHVTPGYIGAFHDKQPLTEDGWLKTGDLGKFDEDGFLYILDRRTDLIVSGGENIYPAEIEQVLMSHPNVQEAGVVGIGDEKWGQVPIAFVVMSPQDEDSLKEVTELSLAKFKRPVAYYFVDQLPRNAANKLLRRELTSWHEKKTRA